MVGRQLTIWAVIAAFGALASPAHAAGGLPPMERYQLDNGLTVLLVPNGSSPYLEMRLVLRAGANLDPVGKEGLASLTGELLTAGTPTRSQSDIANLTEAIGASLYATTGTDQLDVNGSVITLNAEDVRTFQELFVEVTRAASFPEDVVKRTVARRQSMLQQQVGNHALLADAALRALLYPGDARGRLQYGLIGGVAEVTRADVLAYRDAAFVPQHAVLAVGGFFQPSAMRAWIAASFGSSTWGKGACTAGTHAGTCAKLCAGARCFTPLTRTSGPGSSAAGRTREVLLVDVADATLSQVQWRLGARTPIPIGDERWFPFRVGVHMLGGGSTSRLFQVLREREGLTYGAYFSVDHARWQPGPMRISTFVEPPNVARSIELALGELTALQGRLDDEEVERIKSTIVNKLPFRFETVSDAVDQYVFALTDELPADWHGAYASRINGASNQQIQQAMGTISAKGLALVAVGNADLTAALSTYGRVRVVKASDLLHSGLTRARFAE